MRFCKDSLGWKPSDDRATELRILEDDFLDFTDWPPEADPRQRAREAFMGNPRSRKRKLPSPWPN